MKEKALTIKQPWAYLICAGIKDIENRTWATKYRGRVYIHASMDNKINLYALTKEQYNDACDKFDWNTTTIKPVDKWDRSAIIGHVDIVDCVINHESIWADKSNYVSKTLVDPDIHSLDEWITDSNDNIVHKKNVIYNWVLANPVLFDKPILNVKGKLSFWDCSQYIHSEIDEDGKPVCMCNLGIDEKDQVMSLGNEFRCNYCDGKCYK